MKLTSFRVRMFRNVLDSGDILVVDSTCLVGKNEAGKSATIEALHRLNPAKPLAHFSLLDDYPRWLKKEHELTGEIENAVPITATFELSSEQLAKLESTYCPGVLKNRIFSAKRGYSGGIEVELSVDYRKFIDWFVAKHAPSLKKTIAVTNSQALEKRLAEIEEEKDENGEATAASTVASEAKAQLKEIFAGQSGLNAVLMARVKAWIPKTFYFSRYAQLSGRYKLDEVLPAVENGSDDESIEAAAEFLKLAKITAENVQANDFEQSNSELEAVSSLLTKRVRDNWKQNQHLKLAVKIESQQHQRGHMEKFLQFRVEDTRHDFTSRLDRRSTGFQWFVSFIASFFEFEADKNIVLLLDEPGLSLHARAQMDLLNSIDTNLTKGRQVIYTTHSPFMVKTESLDRVRIVEDKGPECGSIVTNDAGNTSDPDTLFPLQAALGYDIAQNLFIGRRNILVEGVSDLIYLSVLASHLGAQSRRTLPTNARVLPAGGATNIPTFIALLGSQLEIVVLLDGDAPRQKVDNAIADGRLKSSRVLTVERFSGVKGADIEDMFTPSEYLTYYNGAFGSAIKIGELKGNDRIVKRIERVAGEFDHGRVAAHFVSNQAKYLPKLSVETLQRFEDLFAALTAALPSEVA